MSSNNVTKDDLWAVFKQFIKETGLARQHLDSYNAFVSERIQKIVDSFKEVRPAYRLAKKGAEQAIGPDVKVVFGKVRVGIPQVKEADRNVRQFPSVTPLEARLRNFTYSAPLYLEMTLIENNTEVDHQEVKVADFPIMIKSVADPLSKLSEEELIRHGEDPRDPGGYFIINGSERVVVAQEDLAVNRIIVGVSTASTAKITHSAKTVSTVLGLRRQVIVDRMSDGSLEISMSRLNYRIPFVVMMKALGLEKDADIAAAVSPDPDIQRELLPSFEKVSASIKTQEDALEFLGNRIASGQPKEIRIQRAEEFIDTQFLPHLGTRPSDRKIKAYFLGEMANRVLQLYLGKRPEDDKDHLANKRLRLAGDLIAEIFRDAFQQLVNTMSSQLEEYISQHKKIKSLDVLVRPDIVTERVRAALATGNWTGNRTGVSQALDRTNWMSLLSHLRRVISPLSRGQSNFEARDLHGTHWGRLCPFETPEGINCGLVKNLAMTAYISVGVDEEPVERLLYGLGVVPIDEAIKEMASGEPEASSKYISMAKVFLNGRPIGYVQDGRSLAETIRSRRRKGEISFEVSVAYLEQGEAKEVYINTDEGRLMRPVIVVENGTPRLTKDLVDRLEAGELSFWDLVKMGVIEFLDPDEEENAYIAETPEELTPEHTHLELWSPGIFSVVTSIIPYLEHNQSPRNTYQAAMAKQALGLYALNYQLRMDSHAYLLHYPQKPIVLTRSLDLIGYNDRPSGQNFVVAVMTFMGYNMEDALIMNRTSVDYGLARAHFFRVYVAQENEYPGGLTDRITVPSPKLYDHKGDQYYTKLGPDGIIEPEVEVAGGDVLVGRESPPRFLGEERVMTPGALMRRDTSVQLRYGEKGVVDMVVVTQTLERNKLVKVRVRDLRIPELGDKFASRHGQKGVIGMLFPKYDMPYTEEGLVPDAIINPHAIPSRMTVGQLLELITGKAGALEARYVDGTPFFKEDIEPLKVVLLKNGYAPDGTEVMYDGRTGRLFEKPIAIGLVFYQRLYHMVADKMHARATGKVQLLTRQPTEGKARQGGLRFGEMERDCLVGHGATMLLRDRMLDGSDAFTMYVCTLCGHIAWYNAKKGVYECPVHGENGDIRPVKVPYAFKLLLQEIMSMGIKPKIEVVDKTALVSRVSPLSLSKLSAAANESDNGKGGSGNGSEDRR
ncbi:MAG: DNA-directed RNA polymerase subunit B [uncultured Acidilobus sp. JCHS]|nr:MAG: DNA-directed RNA polymerase subunit B [uncultured Acidilobus sp. JCHS]